MDSVNLISKFFLLCLLQIQIGCQTDRLHAEELKRPPSVHERFPVTSEMIQVWNLWGGLLYLVAPPQTQVQGAEATVQMAVPAPYYKSGVLLIHLLLSALQTSLSSSRMKQRSLLKRILFMM